MATQFIRYPDSSQIKEYGTSADFPASAPNGSFAFDLSTDSLYVYNSGSMSWVLIASPSAGGVTSVGTYDSQAPAANGATIVGTAIYMQSATASVPGEVNISTQTFAGNKTFTGTIAASNLSGTNTGDVTIGTANGLSLAGQVLSLQLSDATHTGALSSTDWNRFNNSTTDVTLAAIGSTPNANGASIASQVLNLQPANGSFGGVLTTGTQTIAGSKTLSGLLNADGGIDRSTVGTLTIGATNSTTINIGNASATVNIQGTTIYENTPILQVADPLITVNHGGGAGSGQNAGIEIEEASVITGYAETSSNRNSWILKAPNTAGIITLTPGSSGFTIDQGSHNPVTIGTANGLSLSTQVLSLQAATTSLTGALTSTDWNTFNGKQAAGNYITALTGDATASGPGSVALTLATVNSNVGSFGSSISIPSITVNAKGLVTAASANVVIAPAGTLSGTTLNSTVVSSSLTSVGTITTGVWNGTTIATANGGTNLTSYTTGDILYASATNVLSKLAIGGTGNVLTVAAGIPSWAAPATSGTVTSVAMTVPNILSVSGSPITTSGTLAVTLATQNANIIFAGPSSGGAAIPTFRSLVAADIPAISLTTGVSGILPIANGGTAKSSISYATLTDGATITWTVSGIVENATVTLGGNRTLAFSGIANGMTGTLIVKQDATGSRTLALPAGSKVINSGAGVATLSTTANAIDILAFTYDGTNYYWTLGKSYT